MTTEIEKTFFDTFGVKPKTIIEPRYSFNTEYYEEKVKTYPQITDRILLELICIHNQYLHPLTIYSTKKEFLKNNILKCIIDMLNYFYEHEMGEYSKLKHQIRILFEEVKDES